MANLVFKFLANEKGLNEGIRRSKKQLSGLEQKTRAVGQGMKRALSGIGIGIGISVLTGQLMAAGRAAVEDARSQRLLALQMKTTAGSTDKQIASNEAFIQTLSNQVGIVDDELRPAFANLLRGTGKVSKAQKLLKIALDFSAASGKPLASVTQALTRANGGQMASLYKLAPQLKATKGGIDELARSVKGAAATAADPFTKLTVILDNMKETIGNALMPAFQAMADWLIVNAPIIESFIKDMFDPNSDTGKSLKKFGDALNDLGTQINTFFTQFDPAKKSGVVGFFTLLADTIQSVADELEYLGGLWQAFTSGDISGVVNSNALKTAVESMGGQVYDTQQQKTYTINVNKSNMSGEDIIRAIQRYERNAGRTYLQIAPTH